MPVDKLHAAVLERIFALASLDQALWETPDYATLKACALVYSHWRHPAQATLARHVRIASPEAMAAVRSRECRRMLAEHQTLVLDSTFLWGADTYWLLDRFPKLVSFRLEYDPLRGNTDGQRERDDEWLTWDVLRHPSLTGVSKLSIVADLEDPEDTTPLSLPVTHATLGRLPYEHNAWLHHAIFTGSKATLRDVSLDFSKDVTDKLALDNLIEEFQAVAATVEHLHFLNKPNINFLMSLHSKMNAIKMPFFYSCSYPLLPNALAPFNILALAVVNNGTSLVEFALVEPPYLERATDDDHEALVLRYIAAFGSRLDSFNMMGRKFRFRFPREWAARFVKLPEIARFLDRAGARGCDVWCGAEQRFESTAKAMEKRKGKRVATGGVPDDDDDVEANTPPMPTLAQVQQVLRQMTAPGAAGAAARAQAAAARALLPPPAAPAAPSKAKAKGKGKVGDKVKGKGKSKAGEKGKGKSAAVAPPQEDEPEDDGGLIVGSSKGKGKSVAVEADEEDESGPAVGSSKGKGKARA
ncbi:uncharacterized protein RHOBADRAFT_52292 [Rhodotorula graminis WP1]|uniref:Uncharacterized protein n=1 Tax=Rhodotorula graminis (strain WP1) TaxID=578459 RepID=A0A194S6A0_RHOGW|nr:uncharacterized protein RHOBADRAFT_52292 [Rhodotorula graminis WP1]KPV76258.1 hypothetical protein RHOBADRAFT_52292 [Rhodotorula graminis WP1]